MSGRTFRIIDVELRRRANVRACRRVLDMAIRPKTFQGDLTGRAWKATAEEDQSLRMMRKEKSATGSGAAPTLRPVAMAT